MILHNRGMAQLPEPAIPFMGNARGLAFASDLACGPR
jgi:hypothetical protein